MGDEFLALEKFVNLNYMGFHKVGAGAVSWRAAGGGLYCKRLLTGCYMGFHKVGAGAVSWRTAGGGLCCKSLSTGTTRGSKVARASAWCQAACHRAAGLLGPGFEGSWRGAAQRRRWRRHRHPALRLTAWNSLE